MGTMMSPAIKTMNDLRVERAVAEARREERKRAVNIILEYAYSLANSDPSQITKMISEITQKIENDKN